MSFSVTTKRLYVNSQHARSVLSTRSERLSRDLLLPRLMSREIAVTTEQETRYAQND